MSSVSSASSSSSRESSPSSSPAPKRKRAPSVSEESDSGSESEAEPENAEDEGDPVLSHAEKRRQKKLAKQEKKEERPAKKAKLDVTSKRQNSVWVGNLSFKTTEESLRTFFDGVGEITRINMPLKAATRPGLKGECRGFAYVDFATPDAKATAISLSERPLLGRKLLIKDGDDFTGRPAVAAVEGADDNKPTAPKTHSKTAQKILREQKQPPAPTLFLGNLGFETTEDSIRQLFEAHRHPKKKEGDEESKEVWLRKVRMGTFEDSGACKGFAFVDFASTEHATSALINIKNHFLDGRKLKVEYASADAVRRGQPKPPKTEGISEGRPRGQNKTRRPPRSHEVVQADQDKDAGDVSPKAISQDRRDRDTTSTRRGGGASAGGFGKNPRNRPRPGAALALAQRQSAAIVTTASTTNSKKITF
ncbi:hypothetical protein CPB85DRAFT_1294869 [Mucidula mucida]|nr:hypothetical protein CPB85DRAFT_1294869 [Mucidula mucida]